jgi:hypothetical protein
MIRAFALFLVLFGIATAFIFGYKYITKQDIKIAGKLTFAAIIALVLATLIYIGEVA